MFTGIVGNDLQFRGIVTADSIITVVSDATDVRVGLNVQNLLADAAFQAQLDQEIEERIDPSNTSIVGGVHAQHSQVASGVVTASLPAGGTWRYTLTGSTHNNSHPRFFPPGFYAVSGNWDGDEEEAWRMSGQAPGGSSWSFSDNEPKTLSLFAIRVA